MLTRRGWSLLGASTGLYIGSRILGLVQLVALAAPLVLVAVALVLRRFRLAVLLVAVPLAAAVLEGVLAGRLDRLRPPLLERALAG